MKSNGIAFVQIEQCNPIADSNDNGVVITEDTAPELTNPVRAYADASRNHETGATGLGWLVVDAHTTILAYGGESLESTNSIESAELQAILAALEAARQFDTETLWLCCDNGGAIDALNREESLPECESILTRLHTKLASVPTWKARTVSRSCTEAVDLLANRAQSGQTGSLTHTDTT